MRRDEPLYQLRAGPGQTPGDVLRELVHAAWAVLAGTPGGGELDPHRWPGLYDLFREAFRGRLVHYPGCGEREECRMCLKSVADETPFPAEEWSGGTPVYTLESGRSVKRLSRLLAGLACRRFRPSSPAVRKGLLSLTAAALEKVLEARTYHGDACAECPARQGPREKRLWPVDPIKRSVS